MNLHPWKQLLSFVFAASTLFGCVEQVVDAPHDCPQTLQAGDLIASGDASSFTPGGESKTDELVCIWDTCQIDDDCGFNEKCYMAKDYDWGRCFWEEQFGCQSDDECNPGTGMICGEADKNTTSFYEGMEETQCRFGCNDDQDCRLLEGLLCVSSKWDSNWKFCADGCNTDDDCITDSNPLGRCMEDPQREYKTCKEYCSSDEECIEAKGEGARCSSKNVCLVGNQCVDVAECALGEYCDSYAGCSSCKVDGDCRGPPFTDGNFCESGRCVFCREDGDCDDDFPICTEYNSCTQCRDSGDCPDFHECDGSRCYFVGCKTDEDCMTISEDRGMGALKDAMVCVISGDNHHSSGQCKVGCTATETCEDLRELLPEWRQNDQRGKPKPNWDSLDGACAPPCVGGTCRNY